VIFASFISMFFTAFVFVVLKTYFPVLFEDVPTAFIGLTTVWLLVTALVLRAKDHHVGRYALYQVSILLTGVTGALALLYVLSKSEPALPKLLVLVFCFTAIMWLAYGFAASKEQNDTENVNEGVAEEEEDLLQPPTSFHEPGPRAD
jgi:hypothetical protein